MAIRLTNISMQALFSTALPPQNASSVLTFTQTINTEIAEAGTPVDSAMTFGQSVGVILIPGDSISANSVMELVDTVFIANNPFIADQLALSQTLSVVGPITVAVSQPVAFTQSVSAEKGLPVGGFFLEQSLGLTGSVGRAREISLTSELDLSGVIARIFRTESVMTLTQNVVAGIGPSVRQVIQFTQSVGSQNDFFRFLIQDQLLVDAVAYYVETPCGKKKYQTFNGSGDPLPPPRLITRSQFAFESLSGQRVVLRSPEQDNIERLSFDRVNRETRGGELNVYRDPSWPIINTLLFTIVGIKTSTFTTLQNFLFENLGQEILLHDWTGSTWLGIITNPNEAASEDQDGFWTLAFEFEGQVFAGSVPTSSITFTQDVGVVKE